MDRVLLKTSVLAQEEKSLSELLIGLGEPAYRARQVLAHVWQYTDSFQAMTDLPRTLREKLAALLVFPAVRVVTIQHDPSGPTDKFLLELADGAQVEAVLMQNRNRPPTLCVSSQVGCPLGCRFCATGLLGFKRNLTFDELFGQIWMMLGHLRRRMNVTATPNIVFMGMGEPLLNRRNLFLTLQALTDPARVGMGDRHVTISTIGVPEGIRELADLALGVNLALSLHHPEEEPRRQLMPFARATLSEVMDALAEYAVKTKRLVTFEYVLLGGVNDRRTDARHVLALVRAFGHPALVNLIPFNPVAETPYRASSREATAGFLKTLRSGGVRATLRRHQGRKIDAACGQLALRKNTALEPLSLMR